jgi:hypothetical protein
VNNDSQPKKYITEEKKIPPYLVSLLIMAEWLSIAWSDLAAIKLSFFTAAAEILIVDSNKAAKFDILSERIKYSRSALNTSYMTTHSWTVFQLFFLLFVLRKLAPIWHGGTRPYGPSGVVVMITIFCDIRQFSAKKLAFFSKTNVIIKILHNLALFFNQKHQFFRWFFRRK